MRIQKKLLTLYAVVALLVGGFIVASGVKQVPPTKPVSPAVSSPSQPFATKGSGNKLVIYFHGHGETAKSSLADPQRAPIYNKLIADGYTIAASDAHGNVWGNTTSVNDYVQLYQYLNSKHHYSRVVAIGQSMGGLASLNTIATGKIPFKAWVGIYPATNLSSLLYDQYFNPEIHAAYKSIEGQSPIDKPASSFTLPMLEFASPDDTVVPKATNADALYQLLQARGNLTEVTTSGNHGDPSNFQTDKIVKFLEAN